VTLAGPKDGRLEEPLRIARGVMSTDDDEHARHLFADAARNKLRHLAAEVDDEDGVCGLFGHAGLSTL
jgi:hypothetical protein